MNLQIDKIEQTLSSAANLLVQKQDSSGSHWQGRLSSSAIATATAVFGLFRAGNSQDEHLVASGLRWLADNQNKDGGWGDTTDSYSNISTTLLAWCALSIQVKNFPQTIDSATNWIIKSAGSLSADDIAAAVNRRYGNDRTFSTPILTMCALAGKLGQGRQAWQHVYPLPFELAALPPKLLTMINMPVVSYAMPALIAMGLAHFHHCRPGVVNRLVRNAVKNMVLRKLRQIQPASGGFLEATPLTAFVVMSLSSFDRQNPVIEKGLKFLRSSARPDGSWAIDTNLATWVTTLSVRALSGIKSDFNISEDKIVDWLLGQQGNTIHPYTNALSGGWGWTNHSGAVPDADDTAGAVIALKILADGWGDEQWRRQIFSSAMAGIEWLRKLQNKDGGIPTFCRGWGKLEFDRSSPDLTAHAILAMLSWLNEMPQEVKHSAVSVITRAIAFLGDFQQPDGNFLPLWFGNQDVSGQDNPTYGTSRVLLALRACRTAAINNSTVQPMLEKAISWLISVQNSDGGWGGSAGVRSTIEETSLAVEALADVAMLEGTPLDAITKQKLQLAISKGANWLIEATAEGKNFVASPIGLYFAKLWYHEELYPLIFAVSALKRVLEIAKMYNQNL